jgi:hypothetical protein
VQSPFSAAPAVLGCVTMGVGVSPCGAMVAGFFLNKAKIGTDLFLIEAKNKKTRSRLDRFPSMQE